MERKRLILLVLGVWLALCVLWSCASGAVEMSPGEMWRAMLSRLGLAEAKSQHEAVLWSLRMPRAVLGALAGAALAMAGAALQGLFRNPMADPALIGVSAGGAMGAVLATVAGVATVAPVAAMAGAIGVVAAVYVLGKTGGRVQVHTMLLAGLAVNALAGAVVGFMLQMLPYESIRGVAFWLLGSLGSASWKACGMVALLAGIPLLLLPQHSRALNALLLGEAEAFHLGYDVPRVRRKIIVLSAAMVGVTVAYCGAIGFVGLIVPHIVRMLLGPDHRLLLPGSALAGASLMVLADLGARTFDAPAEIPVGVLTAMLGAPFFIYLIVREKQRVQP